MIKNSIKYLIRQYGRTILFLSLIVFITLILVLAVCMRTSSNKLIKTADSDFLTIAELDYIGENYPDSSSEDKDYNNIIKDTQIDELTKLKHVKGFEQYSKMRAYIGDYAKSGEYQNYAVIMFRPYEKAIDGYKCILLKNYYNIGKYPEGCKFTLDSSYFNTKIVSSIDEVSGKITYTNVKPVIIDRVYIAVGQFFSTRYDLSSNVFVPKRFVDSQTKCDRLNNILKSQSKISASGFYSIANGNNNPFKFISYFNWDDYENIYCSYSKISKGVFSYGPFIDITNNIDAFNNCIYNDEWIGEQETIFTDTNFIPKWQSYLYSVIKSLDVLNNSVNAVLTDNPEYQPVFHQQNSTLESGRFYNEKDGKNVCVISDVMALTLKLNVGDTINIGLHSSNIGDSYESSYSYVSGFRCKKNYKIIGIYDLGSDDEDIIYMPVQAADENASLLHDNSVPAYGTTYKIGTFIIDNSYATKFADYAEKELIKKCKITVYDQGYIELITPLFSLKDTSILIGGICAFVGLSVISLFAYIFITKQERTAEIMLNLGTGKFKTLSYLMFGSSLISLIATMLGAISGYYLSDYMLNFAYNLAAKKSIIDLSYSTLRTGAAAKVFNLDFSTDFKTVLLTGAAVFAVCVIICLIFSYIAIISKHNSGENKGNALRQITHVIRQAVKSIVRNPSRSIIVPAVSLAIVILLSVFCNVLNSYTIKENKIYADSVSVGCFTSLNGKTNNDLLLSTKDVLDITLQNFFSDVNYTCALKYEIYSTTPRNNDGEYGKEKIEQSLIDYTITSPYEMEFNQARTFFLPDAIFCTSLEKAPLLSISVPGKISYYEKYNDNSFFSADNICAVSSKTAEKYNLALGDKVKLRCSTISSETGEYLQSVPELTIAAVYTSSSSDIYVSIPSLKNTTYEFTRNEDKDNEDVKQSVSLLSVPTSTGNSIAEAKIDMLNELSRLNSFSFTISDNYKIPDLRKFLSENGYSYPSHIGKYRRALIIDDSALQNSLTNIIKLKTYFEALYPLIFIIIIAISFVVTYLINKTRKQELAIIRSLGAGKARAFFVFFTEQFILAICGTAAGVLISLIILSSISSLMLLSLIIYIFCYLLGTIFAIAVINNMNVFQTLSNKE